MGNHSPKNHPSSSYHSSPTCRATTPKTRFCARITSSSLERSRAKVKNTGQTKTDLMKTKSGKIISKKKFAAGKKAYKKNGLSKWTKAFMQARKNLGLKGFVACKK